MHYIKAILLVLGALVAWIVAYIGAAVFFVGLAIYTVARLIKMENDYDE